MVHAATATAAGLVPAVDLAGTRWRCCPLASGDVQGTVFSEKQAKQLSLSQPASHLCSGLLPLQAAFPFHTGVQTFPTGVLEWVL